MKTMEMTLNGLELEQMQDTVAAIEARPEMAKFQFRTRNRWIGGGENRSAIRDFYGACQEDSSRTEAWEFTNGNHRCSWGTTKAPTPWDSCGTLLPGV